MVTARRGMPRHVRVLWGALVAVLCYGTVVHIGQLVAGGLTPYDWAPPWLAGYFTSLTLVDPLAAGLLWARRAAGLHLAVAVLVTDAAANGYAAYGLGEGGTTARVAHAVITTLAAVSLAAAPVIRPYLRSRGRSPVQ